MDCEIRKAGPQDYDDLIDFANMVFKLDFKPVHPRLYDGHPEQAQHHFMALENGRIKAVVGSIPMTLHVLDTTLTGYGIGTVSVHPYARGKGYMKALMKAAVEQARAAGAAFMCLGGQRQRYEYFGFSVSAIQQRFTVTPTNRRHYKAVDTAAVRFVPLADAPEYLADCRALHSSQPVWMERADFAEMAHTWQASCEVICWQDRFAGYCIREEDTVTELLLGPDIDPLPVVLALVEHCGREVTFLATYEQGRLLDALAKVAERTTVCDSEMLQVLDFARFTEAFLRLKNQLVGLPDGRLVFEVSGQGRWALEVQRGAARLTPTQQPADWSLPQVEAQNRLFDLGSLYRQGSAFANSVLPLPVIFKATDMV